jgi:hypothetical protein
MIMDDVLRILISTCVQGEDWLGFKVTKKNPYTYHHIKKKCEGGLRTLENGAPLTAEAQKYVHGFEHHDMDKFNEINEGLLEKNKQLVKRRTIR